jgi:hypothetical protein
MRKGNNFAIMLAEGNATTALKTSVTEGGQVNGLSKICSVKTQTTICFGVCGFKTATLSLPIV